MPFHPALQPDLPRLAYPLSETLFLSDLDGTLLNTQTNLSPLARHYLPQLLALPGLHLSFATAREFPSVREVLPGISFKYPVVSANGSFLSDPQTGEAIEACYFTAEEVKDLQQRLAHQAVLPLVYADHGTPPETQIRWLAQPEADYSEGTAHYLQVRRANQDQRLHPLDSEAKLWEGSVFCVNLMDEPERLAALAQSFLDQQRYYVIYHQELYRPEWWLSLYPQAANKGAMGRCLAERLGLKHLVTFGDASNDVPLFMAADASYVVSNGHPILDEFATARLPLGNDQDAVILFLLEQLKHQAPDQFDALTPFEPNP